MNDAETMMSLFIKENELVTFEKFLWLLKNVLKNIEENKELPKGCLFIRDNFSKDKKLTSQSICIHEPYYPAPYGDDIHDSWIENVVTFSFKEMSKEGNCCELTVNENVLNKITVIGSPKIFPPSKNSYLVKLRYSISDPALLDFMNKRVIYAIEHYQSYDDHFGCCSRYIQCSDAKKCIHPNKLFSTACAYRRHLEKGHIFYGKNKNVDLNQ